MKTIRGFELNHFEDDYGVDCSIQESSACEPHVWLGVHRPRISIMWKDRDKFDCNQSITKDDPETNERGWCTVNLPEEALIESRMHLNRKQAKALARKLLYFARHGYLKDEK